MFNLRGCTIWSGNDDLTHVTEVRNIKSNLAVFFFPRQEINHDFQNFAWFPVTFALMFVEQQIEIPTLSLSSENLFKTMADELVLKGFKDVGYEYIIIDDCWLDHERDENGKLKPDPKRFPSGIKALADYVKHGI